MFEDVKERLQGCVYTIFTPFDAEEKVDYTALDSYLEHMYRTGARKFYAMAYNSRYSQLTHAEIMELNAFCIRKVKALDPKNVAIVGDPIHCSTKETTEFSRHAKEHGADLVSLLVREKYFSDEQIMDHYAEVGRDANIGMLVHEMPFLSGMNGLQMHWPKSLFLELPKVPEIVALKEDAKDFETTCLALSLEPRIRVVIAGRKSALMPYRPHGARAYLNGISMLDARIGETFWKAWETGDDAKMKFIIEKLEAPFVDRCCGKYGWHRSNKALLQAAGFMHRRDRMPMPHLNDADYALVEEVYKVVSGALKELT